MAATVTPLNPDNLEAQVYSPQDLSLLSIENSTSTFNPSLNYVEYTIQSLDGSYQLTNHGFTDYQVIGNLAFSDPSSNTTYEIGLDPEKNLLKAGFSQGDYNVIYSFFNNELNSSFDGQNYFIKSISSDRTEVRLASNVLSNFLIENLVKNFKTQLANSTYFQDFYLNFGDNNLVIANNMLVDNTSTQYEVLINLYEPLPPQFNIKDTLWVVTKVADPLAFNVSFQLEVVTPRITNPTLKGPNLNLPFKDRVNNSTNYLNYEQLLNTGFASSYNQIVSYLAEKSIEIGIDYSNFNDFVYFSSATSRVENFFYKVQLIEQYSSSLGILNSTTSASITSSALYFTDKITNIIKNFDGFEYYLYYSTGSTTYPKSTTTPPYTLITSSNASVTTWYNGLIASASLYDQDNQNYLINTIPAYLRDDPQNAPYSVFIDMIGQHYDNIWVYYKDVTNRYSGDNRLDYGISKDLVADAIRSFGLKIYQNNFSVNDLFNAFTGFASGSLLRGLNLYPVDAEKITTYVTASQESYYTPLDDVNKEMYKRIYHNLPYLLKSKGTTAGLQNIISMFGITSSILQVSEFGGNYTNTIPRTGVRDIINDRILILSSGSISASLPPINTQYTQEAYTLSPFRSLEQVIPSTSSVSQGVSSVEIAFSPQNEVDNHIISTSGYFDIGEYIGDPRQSLYSGYPNLTTFSTSYFSASYSSSKPYYDLIAYIRLIQYFDNSLFKMIKDFVPARTNLKSGIVIKQHLLERSKHIPPQVTGSNNYYSGSIASGFISGSTGGTFNDYNSLTPRVNNTQSWYQDIKTPLGLTRSLHSDQSEFYNGELPYYPTVVTNGELDPANPFKFPIPTNNRYFVRVYNGTNMSLKTFLNSTNPSSGNIYAWGRRSTVEYLKIHTVSQNSINNAGTLARVQNVGFSQFPNATATNPSQLDVETGAFDNVNNYWLYAVLPNVQPYPLPTSPISQNNYMSFTPGDVIWDYYEYNPIINNSADDVRSTHYMEVDLDTGILTPSNFTLLISESAARAAVQDSNYSSNAWSNIRYNGSRQSSRDFNVPY